MNMEITIVKTFCDFGHNVFKKQPFLPFCIRILAISYEKIWQPCSGQRNAAEQMLLPGYQFSNVKIPIEYGRCVTRCSISSFVTAGLWPRPGYRGGRVSETKGNALA